MGRAKVPGHDVGDAKLSEKTTYLFIDAAKRQSKSQELFILACKSGMNDLKKRYKDLQERFEVVKDLARPTCLAYMEATAFASYCTIARKIIHYGIADWNTAKAPVQVLDEAVAVVAAKKRSDGTIDGKPYQEAMKEAVATVTRKRQQEKYSGGAVARIAPVRPDFTSDEAFSVALWRFMADYFAQEGVQSLAAKDRDLAAINKIIAKHKGVSASKAA